MSDVGKGYFYNAVDCQTFWTKAADAQPYCDDPVKVDRACVANYTKKIPGDLTAFDVSIFESFLVENLTVPFLAYIALSTNHVPHYALPEWYHAYTDTLGKPAGDYLGSLSQMDDSLGTLRKVLQDNNVEGNTLFLFTTDNGRSKSPPPLATENLLDNTDGVLRPPPERGVLPFSYADECCIDAVIVSQARTRCQTRTRSTPRVRRGPAGS